MALLRHDYFRREKFVLKIFGLSLTENNSLLYLIYAFSINFISIFGYSVVDFYEMFKHDFATAADFVVYVSAGFASSAKTLVLYRNRKKFLNLLNRLEQPPFIPNFQRGGEIEEKLINECLWITAGQTSLYWVFGTFSIVGATVYTFAHRAMHSNYQDWEFTYGPLTVINITYSPNYEISAAYQCFSMFTIASHFITIDLITASVMAHISYQFKIVKNNMRRLVQNAYFKMLEDEGRNVDELQVDPETFDGSNIPYKYLKSSLVDAVEYHKEVIGLAEEMEFVFSNLLLFVFLGTLSQMAFLIYNTSRLSNVIKLTRYFGELVSFSLQVATLCFWGEQVMHESELVGDAAYGCNFVGTDLRFQKCLAFIIRRCGNPVKLTAGKFTNICLASFMWLMRTSYSTFMVLRHNNSNKL